MNIVITIAAKAELAVNEAPSVLAEITAKDIKNMGA